jgi:hypothetical protein
MAVVLERIGNIANDVSEIKHSLIDMDKCRQAAREENEKYHVVLDKRILALENGMKLIAWFCGLVGGAVVLEIVMRVAALI